MVEMVHTFPHPLCLAFLGCLLTFREDFEIVDFPKMRKPSRGETSIILSILKMARFQWTLNITFRSFLSPFVVIGVRHRDRAAERNSRRNQALVGKYPYF